MNALRQLYRGENEFDFLKTFKFGAIVSLVLVLASVASLLTRELELGIDFSGGTAFTLESDMSVADTRDALRPVGEANAKIQVLGGDTIRVQVAAIESPDRQAEVSGVLAEASDIAPADVSVTTVGPSWGDEISSKALRALIFFLVAVSLYITLRFEWRMAAGGLVAVLHDVIISVGVYSILQIEVTPATVIAFLTILGYSLYDTIVVFDRVQENEHLISGTKFTYADMANLSMNEVIMRSINTSITSLLPVGSMLLVGAGLLGAVTLREFALALLIGLIVGVYSSIWVATPVLVVLHRGGGPAPSVPAASTPASGGLGGAGGFAAPRQPDLPKARIEAKPREGALSALVATVVSMTSPPRDS